VNRRTLFLLPDGLPSVLEPDISFKIRIMGSPSEDWIFRTTRRSEPRDLLTHKVHGGIAMDTGRAPMMFVVGEVLRIVEFRIVFVPTTIVRSHEHRGFICVAAEGQTADELIAEVERSLGER